MNGFPIIVMGVSGSGKSTVGKALADKLGAVFLEGDGFHPPANIAKMSSGIPLTDDDRWPWLDALGGAMKTAGDSGSNAVAACSALRRSYRDRLRAILGPDLLFVLLDGRKNLIETRLGRRSGHFMPPGLLDSQFETLERPGADEHAIIADVSQDPQNVVLHVLAELRAQTCHAVSSCTRS